MSVARGAVCVSQPGALLRRGGLGGVSLPPAIVPTNTLRSHAASRAALQLLPPALLCQGSRTAVFRDDEALLDLWAVIKPGHVREKIAIFAADVTPSDDGGGGTGRRSPPPRAPKAKGNWEQTINAKRRRRSGGCQDLQPRKRSPPADTRDVAPPAWGTAEDKVSVGRMVAYLEQQVSLQQTLQKNPHPPEVKGEEPACVSVSHMVARLESECLRGRSRGDLSRSGSLRRTVGRVLLTASSPPPPAPRAEEPPPGLLFLSGPPAPDPDPERRDDGGARLVRRVSASQDFLEKRQRLQRLLEPQSFLCLLPLHLLLQIFQLLPTHSLAALQCCCHHFKFIIQTYGVRPADALWVSDPRYRDDPCKQCKKRYGRGDVSLCRWHHKPYCQALPYGPGYWMCCHDVRRDAPGCNVGLHDNRWVPAFHSINAPVYRRARPDR